jgi:predicted TIM-barrel fold metal-dependent hydrolase
MSAPVAAVARPRLRLPAHACDSHLHVIGAAARYPFDARRSYTPEPASLEQYRAVMAACNIERAVLVQPSVYGSDNRCLLDALQRARDGGVALRGVAVPEAGASDGVLEAMHALGVRGVRLNLVNPPVLDVDAALALVARMRGRGWHLQLHLRLDADGETLLGRLADRLDAPIVVDHFGRPPPGRLPRTLLGLVANGRAWVKLSASYRLSDVPGRTDLLPLVDALVEANVERVLWGSDWPHTELAGAPPSDAGLVDELAAWLPDAATRAKICAANPARLYGF